MRASAVVWMILMGLLALDHQLLIVPSQAQNSSSCPLNLSITSQFPFVMQDTNQTHLCDAVRGELNLIVAEQLKKTQMFLFPNETAGACIQEFENAIRKQQATADIKKQCNIDAQSLQVGSRRCANITSVADLKRVIGGSSVANIDSSCQVALTTGASCSRCTAAVVSSITYSSTENGTCLDYSHIYAAAIANSDGATSPNTVPCLFYQVQQQQKGSNDRKKKVLIFTLVGVASLLVLSSGAVLAACICWRQRRRKAAGGGLLGDRNATLERSMHPNASLTQFSMEEMRAATRGFHRSMIIGTGGFGNVYKGILEDETVVAVKRFKNCSPAGDAEFIHEVEMISSVRHRNLVPLLGWCIGGSPAEGHQRMILYEFMSNGSLHDHLFGSLKKSLDWPTRQKIAIGTASGLAYLHNGAQPAIIHRDIKGSNILLDANFNARVADFGLAKFAPEGMTHMTTGVAGTQGYVAPEYVMYQQLTDKSDVYSFGIVFLELLTGRKALVPTSSRETPAIPIADWAWSVVKGGRICDILEQPMEEMGAEEVMERFVLVALLCSHPQVACRPSMSQVVKMLKDDRLPLPGIPERPVPLMLNVTEIDKITSSGSSDAAASMPSSFLCSSDGMPP